MKTLTLTDDVQRRLARLPRPPASLSYSGEDPHALLGQPVVAIVGSRKVTPYGRHVTQAIAADLARAGVIVISGLAIGVDGLAHAATLEAGGKTIAVLPSGLDAVYPASNRGIAARIMNGQGCMISEYPADHTPRKENFLERNRIIAALSDLVLIPEAAAHSGSLNTAMHAEDAGVPLAAVPGNVTSPLSAGTNHLLVKGVHAITCADDVLRLLDIQGATAQQSLALVGANERETLILQKVALGENTFDLLLAATKLDVTDCQTGITMLEIDGRLTSDEHGIITIVK